MDANNTKYHLLHGERDWLPVLVKQSSNDIWWDRERKSISLAPIVEQLNELEQSELLNQQNKRGAAYDHYGNIYWIDDERKSIEYQPAVTPLKRGQFWHVDELKSESKTDNNLGDFKPEEKSDYNINPILSGLSITTHEYLIVGTLLPAGILIFDLHSGGPPEWLNWPQQISFSPMDMACAPDGGVWVLSVDNVTNAASVWHLDKNFRLLNNNGDVIALNSYFSNDFSGKEDLSQKDKNVKNFYTGIALNLVSPVLIKNPVAIEALSDEAFIILSTEGNSEPSSVYYFNKGELKDTITLDEEAIGSLLVRPEISGYDFTFIPDKDISLNAINGLLYVSVIGATQAFELTLQASENELLLILQPKLLPMRKYSGRALISSSNKAYYDFEDRWLPISEQPRHLYQSEAKISGIIKDGAEADCVWHRIIIDACIPDGTRIHIESRTANTKESLEELAWQNEPEPYLRSDGSELPLHQPFDENELRSANIGSWDLLLQNAIGRYIELRITLLGTRRSSPRIRSMRIYYPRFSYLNRYLPDTYRDDLISASFLDRFLGNVEGLYTSLEDKISNAQSIFDTRSAPAEFLDWLGAWLGAFMEPVWDENRKRLFIDNAVLLFRWRGTPLGLLAMIKLTISECPDSSIFESLKQDNPIYDESLSGSDIRIVEDFLTRGSSGVLLGGDKTTSLVFMKDNNIWDPVMGAGVLHQNFQKFLAFKYQIESGIEMLNEAWDESYSDINEILFPTIRPLQIIQERDWREFTRDYIGFAYADVSNDDLPLYQDFLARRYQQINRFNNAYGYAGDFIFKNFSDISLPDILPKNIVSLTDWVEFVSLVVPIKENAHKFTVLLPTQLGELPKSMALRKARVKDIIEREKPAHTQFEVKYFWALFQIGNARLGIDTNIGEGSRFVSLVLGENFLGQSFLAESHPWNVLERSIVGGQRLGSY